MSECEHEYHPNRQTDGSYLLACLLCQDTMTFGQASKRLTEHTALKRENEAWNNLMRDMLNSDEQPVVANFYLRAINLLKAREE